MHFPCCHSYFISSLFSSRTDVWRLYSCMRWDLCLALVIWSCVSPIQLHKIYISLKGPIYLHYFATIALNYIRFPLHIRELCAKNISSRRTYFLAKTIIRIISLTYTLNKYVSQHAPINLWVFMCCFAWILFCISYFCIKRRK